MEDAIPGKSLSPIVGFVLLLVTTGGIWYLDQPITTWRPATQELPLPSRGTDCYVRARLWQDPLAALYGHAPEQRDEGKRAKAPLPARTTQNEVNLDEEGVNTVRKNISDALETARRFGSDANVWLMPVTIPGGRYNIDQETRHRARFSVLAALATEGFVQDEWDKLYYFKIDPEKLGPSSARNLGKTRNSLRARRKEASISKPHNPYLLVPYEWFTASQNTKDKQIAKVLLLWLDDSLLCDKPLSNVIALADYIAGQDEHDKNRSPDIPIRIRMLGPTWSSTLQTMFKELAGPEFENPSRWNLRVYSPWATADQKYLLPKGEEKNRLRTYKGGNENLLVWRPTSRSMNCREPEQKDIVIERTIAEDGQLVKELVFELQARGVKLCDEGSVLLISEWDQLYGQLFAQTFRDQLHRSNICRDEKSCREPPRVIYLMGLDGKLPGESGEATSPQKKDGKNHEVAVEDFERPDGQGQVDYLRRLANRLAEPETKNLQAVGILGSDVFDKLLVIKALRDRLPQVIFFTTDLDAHFLHPSQRRWTRNLVVASSFSFDYPSMPEGNGKKSILQEEDLPPLRDTYQTATYASTRWALTAGLPCHGGNSEPWLPNKNKPKLFEIGRTRLFSLASAAQNTNDSSHSQWLMVAAIAGGLLFPLSVAFMVPSARKKRGRTKTPEWLRLRWTATLSFTTVLIAFEICCYAFQTVKEPFAWIEGVSVWPSAILRTLAAILAAVSLAWLQRQIEKNDDELGHLFFLPTSSNPVIHGTSRRWYQWVSILHVSPVQGGTQSSVSEVWEIYRANGKPAQRWKRVALMSGLYLAAAWVLFRSFGQPHVPYRGNGSWWAVSLPLLICVLCQIILTFFVVDATCLCRNLVKQLSHHQNDWPTPAAERWGIPPKAADEVLAVDLVARRTKLVSKMILYPFAVLFLIILSRNLYFDRWDWPVSLLLVYSINSSIAFCCAIALWLSGRKVRHWGLDGLQKKLIRAEGDGLDKLAKQLTLLIEEVRSTREGAFASLSEQPLFVALFLPFGGIGAASLLDLLANVF